jgi:hypothetical protein
MAKIHTVILILMAALFASCSTEVDTDYLNTENLTESNVKIVAIDTFSVEMSTFKYDSLQSNGNDRILTGRYIDPAFGEMKATGYAEFSPQSYYIDEDAIFDSIVLNLKYDGYYYNDTLQQKTITIKELSKEIKLKNSETYYFNSYSFPAKDEVIGQKTFAPRISKDSLTITLNNAFGLNLFNRIRSNTVNNHEELLDYFKGLKIIPGDSENGAIVGFNIPASYMRLYYSYPDQSSSESEYIDFVYSTAFGTKFFTQLETNRDNTTLKSLSHTATPSSSLGDLAFIQAGVGITTKVMLPSIRRISYINKDVGSVFKAQLKIKLDNSYHDKNLKLPDSLYMYVVDQNNDIVESVTNSSGENVVAYVDYQDAELNEVYLIAPVEVFIKRIQQNSLYLKYGLVFVPFNFNNTTDRLILNGENNKKEKTKLNLQYAIYN